MLKHPFQIIRLSKRIVPTVMLDSRIFFVADIRINLLKCSISISRKLRIYYIIGSSVVNTETRFPLEVFQTFQVYTSTDWRSSSKKLGERQTASKVPMPPIDNPVI